MIEILNTIDNYILVIDEDKNIKFCNEALLEKLEYTSEELSNLDVIFINDNIIQLDDIIKLNNSKVKINLKNKKDEKIELDAKVLKSNFNDKEHIFIVGNRIQELEYIESIKNDFFANISHEFKTPLNLILGTIQLLDLNIKQGSIVSNNNLNLSKHIKRIKQNSYRLLRLANNIIDMNRIERGYYDLKLGNYNIVNIIEEITLSVSDYMEQKGINLVFDTDCEELILACDPDKIERIILNLLSNSIKYTDKGGEISVCIKVDDSKATVLVKDSGNGISKEKLPYIFDRYVQDDTSEEKKSEGSGIGLSLVKSLIQMHNGQVYANSEVGVGTEFVFDLPITLTNNEDDLINGKSLSPAKIEKCSIEFSDIYSV